jgi:hypothetical protein
LQKSGYEFLYSRPGLISLLIAFAALGLYQGTASAVPNRIGKYWALAPANEATRKAAGAKALEKRPFCGTAKAVP